MTNIQDRYRLSHRPLGRGGQAEVFPAVSRDTGARVALKRRTDDTPESRDRMRREIQVQSRIQHLNVMPILDHDSQSYAWFTMPLATTTLEANSLPMDTDELAQVLTDAVHGLSAAHDLGFVHRDIKPSNVLKLEDDHGSRWVVADWGVVRRRDGATTARHTLTNAFLGTEGFAPPEAYSNSHDASFAWDAYSLGRLAGWAATGTWPTPLNVAVAPEPWRRFVRALTANQPNRRPQDMARVLELLKQVTTDLSVEPGPPPELIQDALAGDSSAGLQLLRVAHECDQDADFFIDDLAEVSGGALGLFVREDPTAARTLLELMDDHLERIDWKRRDFDQYNVPLQWMQRLAEEAADSGQLDLLEDACAVLFRQEPIHDRWKQKERSRRWLASLRGNPAARVAQMLRENPRAARFYGKLGNGADAAIRGVLRAALAQGRDA